MRVEVNGEAVDLPAGSSAEDAALGAGIDPARRGVAVAVDGEVVPRGQLADTELGEGQRVEVVAAIQGGAR